MMSDPALQQRVSEVRLADGRNVRVYLVATSKMLGTEFWCFLRVLLFLFFRTSEVLPVESFPRACQGHGVLATSHTTRTCQF